MHFCVSVARLSFASGALRVRLAEEDALELVHPRVREEKRRVVVRDHGRGRHHRVLLRLEKVEERLTDLIRGPSVVRRLVEGHLAEVHGLSRSRGRGGVGESESEGQRRRASEARASEKEARRGRATTRRVTDRGGEKMRKKNAARRGDARPPPRCRSIGRPPSRTRSRRARVRDARCRRDARTVACGWRLVRRSTRRGASRVRGARAAESRRARSQSPSFRLACQMRSRSRLQRAVISRFGVFMSRGRRELA